MKKGAIRLTVIFFSVMIGLTFCSRTIYRYTLPKVRAEHPFGGTLKRTCESRDFEIFTGHPVYQYIPHKLSQALRIAKIHVKAGDGVQAGDPLLTFYAPDGAMLLKNAQSELEDAVAQQKVWELELEKAKSQIMVQRAEAKTDEETQLLMDEMRLLQAGYYDGVSARDWQKKIQNLQGLVADLAKLEARKWVYTSDYAGTVCRIYVAENAMYSGVDPILSIAKEEDPIYMDFFIDEALNVHPAKWTPEMRLETAEGLQSMEVEFIDGKTLRVKLPPEMEASEVAKAAFSFESGYEQMLVPNAAIQEKQLYILESAIGDWGLPVYRARKVKVSTGDSDAENTAILEGLHSSDRVIIASTRELRDGQTVVLEGFE